VSGDGRLTHDVLKLSGGDVTIVVLVKDLPINTSLHVKEEDVP
jgi:hypothetical protein